MYRFDKLLFLFYFFFIRIKETEANIEVCTSQEFGMTDAEVEKKIIKKVGRVFLG